MKLLIFAVCAIFAVKAASISDRDLEEWQLYKVKYNKIYTTDEEEQYRMNIFMDNKYRIEEHNARYEKGEVSFEMGFNQFSDMLDSEVSEKYTGRKHGNQMHKKASTFIPPADYQAPDEVNWVEKGAVTPIKNQGHCGSCWAFSATGSLEGQHFMKTGKLVSLSEQNLVDCSQDEGNNGCEGGLEEYAFLYVHDNGGIDTEESYPYEAKDGKCRYKPENSGATDTGFKQVQSGNETALKLAVATVGPISVGINVVGSFAKYKGGIYKDSTCLDYPAFLNHAVLVVGYGTDEKTGEEYWLVKNSWGEGWGEKGYIRMARDNDNMCGIATEPTYPLV